MPERETTTRVRWGLSIHHKLIGLTVILVGVIVGLLAAYFPAQQIEALRDGLVGKAATYGTLISRQVQSAIAFDDRETAREIFDSVATDRDVVSLVLFTQSGRVLYQHGAPGTWVQTVARGSVSPGVVTIGDRIAVVAPVVSLEGPRGTLAIELSTERLVAGRARVTRDAIAVGGAALLFGAAAAWWIARSLTRRLRAIARVATAVAGGDLEQRPVVDGASDEVGALSVAFDAMLAQIETLLASIQSMAQKEQDRLASLVRERTEQLDRCNTDMRLVLDNVDQGLFMVDLDSRICGEQSAAVERLLGAPPASRTLIDWVEQFASEQGPWFEVSWAALRDDLLPADLGLELLPSRFVIGERHLELTYKLLPARDPEPARVLVVVSDITARVERQRAERDERESTALLSDLLRDRSGFLDFYRETDELLARIADPLADLPSVRRHLHTLKGNAAMYGVTSIAEICHDLETRLDEDRVLPATGVTQLVERWRVTTGKLGGLLTPGDRIEITHDDHRGLLEALRRELPHAALRSLVEAWQHELVGVRLQRFAEQARELATRLDKAPLVVRIEAGNLRIPSEPWAPFWSTFGHVVRNAVDHGIETADERRAAGKAETAVLALRARCEDDRFIVEVEDQGRGIDWDRVAAVARAAGMRADTRDDLVEAIFRDGVTTRCDVSEISGRGIGLAAVRVACAARGGQISVHSERGKGTVMRFSWPVDAMSAARPCAAHDGARERNPDRRATGTSFPPRPDGGPGP